jgi:hypothetical protein
VTRFDNPLSTIMNSSPPMRDTTSDPLTQEHKRLLISFSTTSP